MFVLRTWLLVEITPAEVPSSVYSSVAEWLLVAAYSNLQNPLTIFPLI